MQSEDDRRDMTEIERILQERYATVVAKRQQEAEELARLRVENQALQEENRRLHWQIDYLVGLVEQAKAALIGLGRQVKRLYDESRFQMEGYRIPSKLLEEVEAFRIAENARERGEAQK